MYQYGVKQPKPVASDILQKVGLVATGCLIGIAAALCVLYGQMQREPVHLETSQR